MSPESTRLFLLTVAAGKRVIAKAVAAMPAVKTALQSGTVVIVAGTTNAYVAEEVLTGLGQGSDFRKQGFYRGFTAAPGHSPKTEASPVPVCDVVIEKGVWQKGKTIFDAADSLTEGDVVIKGANAVELGALQAAILIGNPTLGTSAPVLQASVGRRAQVILPVGLEKRVPGDLRLLAHTLNAPGASGLRLLPLGGTVVTELQAVELLTGAKAQLAAAGGVFGAEGSCWLAVTGSEQQLSDTAALIGSSAKEPLFGE